MKAFVLSIGENTTKFCCSQLNRYGYDVILLDEKESMLHKYRRFITRAMKENKPVLKVDADVIVNKNIMNVDFSGVTRYQTYNFYTNNLSWNGALTYSQEVLQMVYLQFEMLQLNRPESSACYLDSVNPFEYSSELVVGMHGFFQNSKDIDRVLKNMDETKKQYDIEFLDWVKKIL